MHLREKIKQILNESMGGITGFSPTVAQTPELHKHKDARRKRRERQGEQRLNKIKEAKKKAEKDEVQFDPRMNMQGELRFTLKEAFLVHLAEYLKTGKSRHVMNALRLMEEYPSLAKFVKETSQAALPKQAFSIYAAREHFSEEVGSLAYRSGDSAHNWYLTIPCVKDNCNHLEEHFVMEAKITPDKVLIYVPAFAKMLENLIFAGKIAEPEVNVVRKAKNLSEVVLPSNIDSGLVIEVKKRG